MGHPPREKGDNSDGEKKAGTRTVGNGKKKSNIPTKGEGFGRQ